MPSSHHRICIVKIGSAIIAGDGEHIDDSILRDVCRQIAELRRQGYACIVVSSGATISGRAILEKYPSKQSGSPSAGGGDISEESLRRDGDNSSRNSKLAGAPLGNCVLSAIGQSQLISRYAAFLSECQPPLNAAQVLLTRQTLADRERYDIIRRTLLDMLDHRIVLIINENDPVKSETSKFADDDQIAAYVGGMLEAAHVVFISDAGESTTRIEKCTPTRRVFPFFRPTSHSGPRSQSTIASRVLGGMSSKLEALRLLNILGISSHVVSKLDHDVILRSINGGDEFGTQV